CINAPRQILPPRLLKFAQFCLALSIADEHVSIGERHFALNGQIKLEKRDFIVADTMWFASLNVPGKEVQTHVPASNQAVGQQTGRNACLPPAPDWKQSPPPLRPAGQTRRC